MSSDKKLLTKLGFNRVKINEPLRLYNNWKVGGPADYLYIAETVDELVTAVVVAREADIPFYIIGLGANTLVSDRGVRGLVIINRTHAIKFSVHGMVEVDSGVNLASLMKEAWERNLYGLERMYKAPGTVGGAIYMNAGEVYKKEFFGDLVVKVKVLDENNNIHDLKKEELGFSYRTSRFQTSPEIILSALLSLKQVSRQDIEDRIKEIMIIKKDQPPGPSGGSTFRNPEGLSVASIMDKEFGLKGHRIGGAKFSEKHANFILNTGEATASDIKALIDLAKSKFQEKYQFEPEEEVRYLGEWN